MFAEIDPDIRPNRVELLAAALLLGILLSPFLSILAARADASPLADVIIREVPGAGAGPEQAVARLGGIVGEPLENIEGFHAVVPTRAIPLLAARPDVLSLVREEPINIAGLFELDAGAALPI
jgi:hypothetical protein